MRYWICGDDVQAKQNAIKALCFGREVFTHEDVNSAILDYRTQPLFDAKVVILNLVKTVKPHKVIDTVNDLIVITDKPKPWDKSFEVMTFYLASNIHAYLDTLPFITEDAKEILASSFNELSDIQCEVKKLHSAYPKITKNEVIDLEDQKRKNDDILNAILSKNTGRILTAYRTASFKDFELTNNLIYRLKRKLISTKDKRFIIKVMDTLINWQNATLSGESPDLLTTILLLK